MALLNGPLGTKIRPWIDQHDVLNFGRHALAKGVAFGLLCGLLPLGPIQMAWQCLDWDHHHVIQQCLDDHTFVYARISDGSMGHSR